MNAKRIMLVVLMMALSGCTTMAGKAIESGAKGKLKEFEGKIYDAAAFKWSEICAIYESIDDPWIKGFAREEWRQLVHEIRERGSHGPQGPDNQQGPVLVLFCASSSHKVPPQLYDYINSKMLPGADHTVPVKLE